MIRAGVVGVGSLGEHHARIYSELPQVKLAGVCDSDAAKGRRVAERLRTAYFPDAAALAAEVEIASVAVPTVGHAEVVSVLLEKAVHVLVEKPIAASRQEAEAMIALADSQGVVLQVGHLERFNPAILGLKPFLKRPLFFEGHRLSVFVPRSLDVDVVLDLMIHDLDLVLSFDGSEIKQIHALGIPILTDRVDIANARIELTSGCVANLTASRVSSEKIRKLRFFQPADYVSIDFLKRETEVVSLRPSASGSGKEILRQKLECPATDPLSSEIASFLGAVQGIAAIGCTGQEGLRALDGALRVLEAMKR